MHPGQCILAHAEESITQVGAVGRDHGKQEPAPVSKEDDGNDGCPCHPDDIKHVLRQAGSRQVFSRRLESPRCSIVFGSAGRFQDEFADEARDREEAVDEERARPEQEVEEQEEHVDDERSDVQVV